MSEVITKSSVLRGIGTIAVAIIGAVAGWYLNQPSPAEVRYTYQSKIDSRISSLATSVEKLSQSVQTLETRVRTYYPRELAEVRIDRAENDIVELRKQIRRLQNRESSTVQKDNSASRFDSAPPLPGIPDPTEKYLAGVFGIKWEQYVLASLIPVQIS